jgi:MoaA/NifB/PqqE/SkfB family radical SAM enzyme
MNPSNGPALPLLVMGPQHNYIASFLTFACNLSCSYCINHFEQGVIRRPMMSGVEWIKGLNRIVSRDDLPVTLQGGEPSLHPDFLKLVNGLKPELNIDILTNLQFDIEAFMEAVPPSRVKRNAPYASIRVSYHPETMDLENVIAKVLRMLEKGYSIGIWAVAHPKYQAVVEAARARCAKLGIDFRFKEFLGEYEGRLYGQYKFDGACDRKFKKRVLCRTTELLMDSAGHVFRCHADLYSGNNPVGHILDPDFRLDETFRPCEIFGHCNPCDVKVKTNRFQKFGHTSVEVKFA